MRPIQTNENASTYDEDQVLAQVDYSKLDLAENATRIRLNSTCNTLFITFL